MNAMMIIGEIPDRPGSYEVEHRSSTIPASIAEETVLWFALGWKSTYRRGFVWLKP